MAGKRLGIGVVGAGRWANWAHLPGWIRDQRCKLVAVCDRIIVMYAGQVVEEGDAAAIITAPKHPYTQALLDALPQAGQHGLLRSIPGAPPSLIDVPGGCRFAARCPLVTDECLTWETELLDTSGPGHRSRCLRHDEVGKARAWQASGSA
jgi:oligopeptide/dipeptide ABC transporter ATP-binding protein